MKQEFFSQKNHGGIPEDVLKEELIRANQNMNPSTVDCEKFTIISFYENKSGTTDSSFKPYAIKRDWDGEIFTINDYVTNGTQMKGHITGFDFLENKVFVAHTWSGVGMNLGSLSKVITLPSKFQQGDRALFECKPDGDLSLPYYGIPCEILAVHFYPGKVKYDLDLLFVDNQRSRIYNVDSILVKSL